MRRAGDVAKKAPQGILRHNAHAHFIRDNHRVKRPAVQRGDQVAHRAVDLRGGLVVEQQIRQPKREAVDHHHVHVGDLVQGIGKSPGYFERLKAGAASFLVSANPCVHLGVLGLSCGDEQSPRP